MSYVLSHSRRSLGFSSFQFCFQKHRSVTHPLLCFYHNIHKVFTNKMVLAIFFDYVKAYDITYRKEIFFDFISWTYGAGYLYLITHISLIHAVELPSSDSSSCLKRTPQGCIVHTEFSQFFRLSNIPSCGQLCSQCYAVGAKLLCMEGRLQMAIHNITSISSQLRLVLCYF